MQVTYELQVTDWQAADRFFASHSPRPSLGNSIRRWLFFLMVWSVVLLPSGLMVNTYVQGPEFATAWKAHAVWALWPIPAAFFPPLLLATLWLVSPLFRGRNFRDSPHYKRQITLSIEPDGVRGEMFAPWSQIHFVEETYDHIFIVFGHNLMFIIPKRAFDSAFAATQFAAQVRDHRESALS